MSWSWIIGGMWKWKSGSLHSGSLCEKLVGHFLLYEWLCVVTSEMKQIGSTHEVWL